MAPTIIVTCHRCGGLFMAADGQKTRTCPYCGSKVDLHKAKKAAYADNAFKASEILRELKSKNQSNKRQTTLK